MSLPMAGLVLHALRTLGYADSDRVGERLGLMVAEVEEYLLDAEAYGWVRRATFADESGWTLTEAGKAHGEHLLATELDETGARELVEEVYADFLPVNAVVTQACAQWQLAELGMDEGTPASLGRTVDLLMHAARDLAGFEERLSGPLPRFFGYHPRFALALQLAGAEPAWLVSTDRDSAHKVWFELHEDLIATLGLSR